MSGSAPFVQKKNLILVPSAYKSTAVGDIINFVDFYKDDFDVNILVNDIEEDYIQKDGFRIVNVERPPGKYILATADYAIDAGALDNAKRQSRKSKWYSVWHGVPYKKMFLDYDGSISARLAAGYSNAFDAMISSSKFYTETFLRGAMGYNGPIHEAGCSRMDTIVNNNHPEYIASVKKKLSIPENRKVILYAPTFREMGEAGINLDLERFFQNIGDGYTLLLRLHYTNTLAEGFEHQQAIDVSSYEDISDLYLVSDFMITDYSSAMFEYSALDRPTLFYQYDYDEYQHQRGTYFDLKDYVDEKLIVSNQQELEDLIVNPDVGTYRNGLRKNFMPHEDGQSTKRIVETLNLDPTPRAHCDIILLVNCLNEIGGVHTFIGNFAKYYKQNFNARIFVFAVNEFNSENDQNYSLDQTYIDYGLTVIRNKIAMIQILRGTSGVVISTQYSAFRRLQSHLTDKNVVFMFHGDSQVLIERVDFPNHLDRINDGGIYNYKKIVLLSQAKLDLLKPELTEELRARLDFVENTCFLPYKGLKDNQRTNNWAFVGRLSDEKNPLALVSIAKELRKHNLEITIRVYGDGPLRKHLESLIEENGLGQYFSLEGYVQDTDTIYQDNDGLLMTSKNEGFPMVILEAYSYGKPVVAFDSFSTAKEVVDSGKTGFLVKPGDYVGTLDAMEKSYSLSSEDIKSKYEHYTPKKIFEKWDIMFESLNQLDSVKRWLGGENPQQVADQTEEAKLCLKPPKLSNSQRITRKFFSYVHPKMAQSIVSEHRRRFFTSLFAGYNEFGISIIIPFFNNSKTIEKTLSSAASQNLPDYEIIIVNDGSRDEERERLTKIVSQFKQRGVAIRQFDKENTGLGLTRNFGVERAKKDFVFFLDSDDVLPANALMRLLLFAVKNNLEVVGGVCERVYLTSGVREKWYPSLYQRDRILPKGNSRVHMYKDTICTNKIYRRSAFEKYDLFFEVGLYEDKLFTSKMYSKVEHFGVITDKVYSWLIYGRNTSITTTKCLQNFVERLGSVDLSWDYYSEYVRLFMFKHTLGHDFTLALREFRNYSEEEKKAVYREMKAFVNRTKDYYYPRLFHNQVSIYLLTCLADDDYESFVKMGNKVSNEFFVENEKI